MIMSWLLEQSLTYTTTEELDRLSQSLETTGRDYYLQARDTLQKEAQAGTIEPRQFVESKRDDWPESVKEFWDSGEAERFSLAGQSGDHLEYLVRKPQEVHLFTRPLGKVRMDELQTQIRDTRRLVERANQLDLRRGLTTVLLILMAAIWVISFASLIYIANRMSRPIQQLTAG